MMFWCRRLAAQVEEAVFEPDVLGIFLLAEHRHRQFVGRPSTSSAAIRTSISPVGRFGFTVPSARGTTLPSTRTTHSARSFFGGRESRIARVGHALGQPVMVAQIDEQQAAVIAHAVHPARKPRVAAGIFCAKRAAGGAAVGVHGPVIRMLRSSFPCPAFSFMTSRRSLCGGRLLLARRGRFCAPASNGLFHKCHPFGPDCPCVSQSVADGGKSS